VYIAVVGITYALLLRHLWNPQGPQKIADVSLHDVVPVLYHGFWTIFVPKAMLRWNLALRWLAYPIACMVYTVMHGLVSGWYPYYSLLLSPTTPYIYRCQLLGFPRALANAAGMLVAFFALGLPIVAIDRASDKKSLSSATTE